MVARNRKTITVNDHPGERRTDRVDLHIVREPGFAPMTPRKRDICWRFGIPPREAPFTIAENTSITLKSKAIILLSGPSGSGKSSILHHIAAKIPRPIWVGHGRFPAHRAIVDAIAPRGSLATVLEILTACGLGEPRLWVRQFQDLSDGERFRASLARAVGQALSHPEPCAIFCDEFTAILHRRAAMAVAYNLRKLVTRHGLMMVVATTHEDIIHDLQPDQTIRLGATQTDVIEHPVRNRSMSLRRRVTIERGSVRDYRIFAPMHYRHRDGLGFVDKVFLLKETTTGQPLGILVFAHAPLELSLRNRSTHGRFKRNVRRLNRELRILRRLVMHPDVRGCGLGHYFVTKALPQVGVRFVECLAAMGEVNPVFERAGMQRVGQCPLPKGRMKLLERMKQWEIDPFDRRFPQQIARCPRVRKLVEDTIQDWVNAMHGRGRYHVHGKQATQLSQAFRQLLGSPPIYYLWDRRGIYPAVPLEERTRPGRPHQGKITPSDRHDPNNQSSPAEGRVDQPRVKNK